MRLQPYDRKKKRKLDWQRAIILWLPSDFVSCGVVGGWIGHFNYELKVPSDRRKIWHRELISYPSFNLRTATCQSSASRNAVAGRFCRPQSAQRPGSHRTLPGLGSPGLRTVAIEAARRFVRMASDDWA